MRFLHLSDLHLGKHLRSYDLCEDQDFVLHQAIELAVSKKLDAIVISGDIYDSGAPSGRATELFDRFLSYCFEKHIPVLLISGNHDSEEKLHFASSILSRNGIHIATRIEDSKTPVTIQGVNFFLVPYTNYQTINKVLGTEFKDLQSAYAHLLSTLPLNKDKPNVILCHQAVLPDSGELTVAGSETQPETTASGQVGGSDILPCALFDFFDYVALGHIHKKLALRGNMYYPGALLKYHKDEANNQKAFLVVDISDKGVSCEEFPVKFLHDIVVLQGSLDEICAKTEHLNDYVFADLTDEDFQEDAMAKLKAHYPFACGLDYVAVRREVEQTQYEHVETVDKNELFANFFLESTGEELDEEGKRLVAEEIRKLWRDDE